MFRFGFKSPPPHEFSLIYSESLARLAKTARLFRVAEWKISPLITASPNIGLRYASEVRLGAHFESGEINSRMRVAAERWIAGQNDRASCLALGGQACAGADGSGR